MRSSALMLAAASVVAAETYTTVLTIGYTDSKGATIVQTTTYTYEYSNPLTTLLTQTNSAGIITGLGTDQPVVVTSQPAVQTSQPAVQTSQPAVATIPNGLGDGLHTIVLPPSTGTEAHSFTVSVGGSSTVVLTPTPTSSTAQNTGVAPSGSQTTAASGTGNAAGNSDAPSSTGSAAPSKTNGAAVVAPAVGLISLGSLFAALF